MVFKFFKKKFKAKKSSDLNGFDNQKHKIMKNFALSILKIHFKYIPFGISSSVYLTISYLNEKVVLCNIRSLRPKV